MNKCHGIHQCQIERAIQFYQGKVGSIGYIAEQVHLSKRDIIREFRSRGIEAEFSELTLQEEIGT